MEEGRKRERERERESERERVINRYPSSSSYRSLFLLAIIICLLVSVTHDCFYAQIISIICFYRLSVIVLMVTSGRRERPPIQ